MTIINGRRVKADAGVFGRQILDEMKVAPGRRAVIQRKGLQFDTVDSDRFYKPDELKDYKGRPVKVSDIPDRTKGAFGTPRSGLAKRIITEQVHDVAEHLFTQGVDFDEENADWFVAPSYRLPGNWGKVVASSPLLIAFPSEYPAIPPIGFYLMADIPHSPNGHLYEQAYHDAWKMPLERGWKWYCVYVQPGAWRPALIQRSGDWRRGDNLWTYLTLINEVLASRA